MTISRNSWIGHTLSGGRYEVVEHLGGGGMGSVYKNLDRNIDSEVVIKVPHVSMLDDPEFAARFSRELQALVRLSHPHIVRVSDAGVFEGVPFAVMTYLAGGSLRARRSEDAAG